MGLALEAALLALFGCTLVLAAATVIARVRDQMRGGSSF
jgi:hypothetical protein